jgi:hypothetical protein
LTKTLLNAFLDPKKALTQHYGAIQGLGALGSNVVLCLSMLYGISETPIVGLIFVFIYPQKMFKASGKKRPLF